MPRKDRRFKAEDVLRIYCLHLEPEQKALVDAIGLVCDEQVESDDLLIMLLDMLLSSPFIDVIRLAPASDYIEGALQFALVLLQAKESVEDVNPDLFFGNSVLFLDQNPVLPST